MNNLFRKFSLFAVLLLLGISTARAGEASSPSSDRFYWSQQVFVQAYNNNASAIPRDNPVAMDVTVTAGSAGENRGNGTFASTLGNYINTTTTTDSVYTFGVTDESIAAGTLGRVCVRGPHKLIMKDVTSTSPNPIASGTVVCTTTTAGQAAKCTTAAGTNHGILGKILSSTLTTDTGDNANDLWVWVQPQVEN